MTEKLKIGIEFFEMIEQNFVNRGHFIFGRIFYIRCKFMFSIGLLVKESSNQFKSKLLNLLFGILGSRSISYFMW